MNWPLIVIVGTQLLYSIADLMGRFYMHKQGFVLATFFTGWFLAYTLIRTVATFGQLYVFSTVELGKSMALFGAVSIILSNLLGFLVLKEVVSTGAYIGITLAIIAFLILALV